MNEVEKLYEKAEIKKYKQGYCGWDSNCPYPYHKCNDKCPYYEYEEEGRYPEFTEQKQLRLIKFISKKIPLALSYSIDAWYLKCIGQISDTIFKVNNYLDEGIASLVNELWERLNSTEKEEIKEILK